MRPKGWRGRPSAIIEADTTPLSTTLVHIIAVAHKPLYQTEPLPGHN
jgi:hypothetical protein